ncbi:uncharacterized protein LOC110975759 isoform X2 [Acanthaster planci]|uniref:Uncharacterized protein LOC110975759 isoform X2 n=1 Tax=Acanthaster planci TaxID=133434 RepID=A0A8B7XVZ6_ACAPL|nr:uncharacterized protein LOC110975759 isoform X2 [Acanthaster planci]
MSEKNGPLFVRKSGKALLHDSTPRSQALPQTTGESPALTGALECPARQDYQCYIGFPSDLFPAGANQAAATGALGLILDAARGWWAAFIRAAESASQEAEQSARSINGTTPTDAPIGPSSASSNNDEEDFDFKIWIPEEWELSPVINSTQTPCSDLEMYPPSADELPVADEHEKSEQAQSEVDKAACSVCFPSAAMDDASRNLTYDEIDAMPFRPTSHWHTISAWLDWFLTHLLLHHAAHAQLQIDTQGPYSGTIATTVTSPATTSHCRAFVALDLSGEIRPGKVFVEKPPLLAWATRTVSVAFVVVLLCLLSPACFIGEEQKKEARETKALKRRKGNEHRRNGRRYAAYMNAKGRQ